MNGMLNNGGTKMKSFMDELKNNKIVVLDSIPKNNAIGFLKRQLKKDYPDLYFEVRTADDIYFSMDKLKNTMQDMDILILEATQLPEERMKEINEIAKGLNVGVIVLMAKTIPMYMQFNSDYAIYDFVSITEMQAAYEGN